MVHLDLSIQEIQQLAEIFKTTSDMWLRNRIQAVLFTYRGRTQAEIAADLLVDERTVRRWLEAWRQGGLDGLHIPWAPGAPARIDGAVADEVIDWVRKGPAACGLNRANWTSGELAEHLRRAKGIRVSERTMRAFCQRHHIRRTDRRTASCGPTRPGRSRRGKISRRYEIEAERGACVLLSQDEARFPMVPTLVRTLGLKGHRPVVGTRDNKDIVSAFAS